MRLWRIVVVDTASSDGSAELIVGHCLKSKLIQLEENKRFAAANNLAASDLTSCEWIALVNPDAFPEPQWLEKMLAAAQEYSDYAAFGCKMLTAGDTDTIDGTGDVYIGDVVSAMLAALEYRGTERVFNIGSGCGISLNDVLDLIERVTGRTAHRHYTAARTFDVPCNVLAIDRAQRELHGAPSISFSERLERTVRWAAHQWVEE